jgi:hypothetical protein
VTAIGGQRSLDSRRLEESILVEFLVEARPGLLRKCKKVQESTGKYRKVQASTGKCKQVRSSTFLYFLVLSCTFLHFFQVSY